MSLGTGCRDITGFEVVGHALGAVAEKGHGFTNACGSWFMLQSRRARIGHCCTHAEHYEHTVRYFLSKARRPCYRGSNFVGSMYLGLTIEGQMMVKCTRVRRM